MSPSVDGAGTRSPKIEKKRRGGNGNEPSPDSIVVMDLLPEHGSDEPRGRFHSQTPERRSRGESLNELCSQFYREFLSLASG